MTFAPRAWAVEEFAVSLPQFRVGSIRMRRSEKPAVPNSASAWALLIMPLHALEKPKPSMVCFKSLPLTKQVAAGDSNWLTEAARIPAAARRRTRARTFLNCAERVVRNRNRDAYEVVDLVVIDLLS